LIDPYFFDNRSNREIYLSFLQNKLPELLEEIDLVTRNTKKFGGSKMARQPILIVCDRILQ